MRHTDSDALKAFSTDAPRRSLAVQIQDGLPGHSSRVFRRNTVKWRKPAQQEFGVASPAMLEWLLSHVIHPSVNVETGYLNQIAELKRLQWQSRDEIENRALKRLRLIVAHAYEQFRFCRERLDSVGLRPDDIRTLDDFRSIPTITRSALSKSLDSESILVRRSGTMTSTGGTGGRPLLFLVSRNASTARFGIGDILRKLDRREGS